MHWSDDQIKLQHGCTVSNWTDLKLILSSSTSVAHYVNDWENVENTEQEVMGFSAGM